ncbi:hypothetical protein PV350_05135 [Streptomyces sp. PA03-6a]|nr:hypothetical protein [Streptomyces sp. PA03-6a]
MYAATPEVTRGSSAAIRGPAPGAVAPADAGRALNHAIRALRTRYARSPAVWAPFVHIGR